MPDLGDNCPQSVEEASFAEASGFRIENHAESHNNTHTSLRIDNVQDGELPPNHPKSFPIRLGQAALPTPRNGPKTIDITEQFTRAASALRTGQLVKDEDFTLFESVGALEIMDPKMDSGFLAPGETLEDDYNVLRPLLPEEVVGIIDQLLCYEMAWHEGYPLSQTLFTSVYIDKLLWPEARTLDKVQFYRGDQPAGLTAFHSILRAYCLGLIKCCDFVVQKITSREYFEEEDFCTQTYNRELLTQYPRESIIVILDEASDLLTELGESKETPLDVALQNALFHRLDFRRKLLLAMTPDTPFPSLVESWAPLKLPLKFHESHNLGRPVSASFSPKIQRRLASTVPPKPIVELDYEEAYKKQVQLIHDCQEAVRCVSFNANSTQELISFIWAFNCRNPAPTTYARSCLSSVIFNNPPDVFEMLFHKDLEELVFPEDSVLDPINWTIEAPRSNLVPTDKRRSMASLVDDFTARAYQNYLDFLTTLCQNRCRTRRMLCHSIQAFDQLQADAELIDQELHLVAGDMLPYPLSTWTFHHKLRQIQWIIQLGFEQDIYLPDEFAGMYWWLFRIAVTRADLLDSVLAFMVDREERLVRAKKSQQASNMVEAIQYVKSLIYEARGTQCLAEGLSVLYTLLHYLKVYQVPHRPYSTDFLRYELRMKPFLTIDPPRIPPFEEFDAAIHPVGPYDAPRKSLTDISTVFIKDAESAIRDARAQFGLYKRQGPKAAKCEGVQLWWTKDVSNIMLSCISAGVAVANLRDICTQNKLDRLTHKYKVEIPDVGKRYHDWWVVPKMVKGRI